MTTAIKDHHHPKDEENFANEKGSEEVQSFQGKEECGEVLEMPLSRSLVNAHDVKELPLKHAQQIASRFSKPKPHIYWLDYTSTILLSWGSFFFAIHQQGNILIQSFSLIVSIFSFYRAILFIHELSHFKRNQYPWLKRFWNLSCGFPVMVPSFTYTDLHVHHHRNSSYGTVRDGEYLPFGILPKWKLVTSFLFPILSPLALLSRTLILIPLSCVSSSINKLLWEKFSALNVNPDFVRKEPTPQQRKESRRQNLCVFGYSAFFVFAISIELLPASIVYCWYVLVVCILSINNIRVLTGHAYLNPPDREMTRQEEFFDSIDIPGRFYDELWAPVGLRFHATHHLFPSVPYYQLNALYHALINELPNNETYLLSTRKNLFVALKQLWKRPITIV